MGVHDADADGDDGVVAALHDACRRGDTDQLMKLLDAAASDSANATDTDGDTLLITACRHGKLDVVRVLLAYEADVNLPDSDGASPLCITSERGYLEIVQALVGHTADVNVVKRDGDTALNLAAQRGFMEIVNLLLKNGAVVDRPPELDKHDNQGASDNQPHPNRGERSQVNEEDAPRPLKATPIPAADRAVRVGHRMDKHVFQFPLANAVIPPPTLQSFPTAVTLRDACRNGDLEKVQSLLASGSMIDGIDLNDQTSLHIAAQHGHADIVSVLLENGAQLDVLDRAGNTPLITASRCGCVNVVQALLELGASVSHTNAQAETALIIAAESGHFGIVKELTKANASIHARSAAGETLLTCAARWGRVDIVDQINELGCWKLDGMEASEPSLLSATMHKLQQCGGSMHEFKEAWIGVLDRLQSTYLPIQEKGDVHSSVISSFATIVFQLAKLRASLDQKNIFARLSFGRKHTMVTKALHARLDLLERELQADPAPSTWRETWQQTQDNMWREFHSALNEQARLLDGLNTKADLHEAISLLQYEIVVHGAKYSQESLDVLQGSLDTLLMLSDEEVPDIPRWFVPPHDVDLIICEERPESSQLYEATRGKWLGTDVTVIESRSSRENFVKDVDLWFQVSHPNVLKLYGACHLRHPYLALVENVQSMNLREYLDIEEHSDLKWQKLFGVGLGLKYLHERGCVTGDLRCDRIWVGTDGLAKVISKGSAVPNKSGMTSDTASFRPPECVESKEEFTTASDIFLFGLCIIEVITGNRSWRVDTRGVAASSIGWMALPPRPVEMNLPEWQLVESMCLFDPSRRVKIAYVVEHLKRFADQRAQAAEKTRAAGGASPAETDDLRVHILPQLGYTIGEYLYLLQKSVARQGEKTRELLFAVFKRLVDVFERLQEMHCKPGDVAVQRYCELLELLGRLCRLALSAKSMMLLERNQELHINVLHREIDEVLTLLPSATVNSIHNWKKNTVGERMEVRPANKTTEDSDDPSSKEDKPGGDAVTIEFTDSSTVNPTFKRIIIDRDREESREATQFAWLLPMHEVNYRIGDVIGIGGFGLVVRGTWLESPAVIKYMGYEEDGGISSRYLFLHELRVWYPLNHPHIIKLFGAWHLGKRYFVCEYAPQGTLRSYLETNRDQVWRKLYEVALGLKYLHELNIVHNDLKCDNFLIGVDGTAKIADFGLSCIPGSVSVKIDPKKQGAQRWRSPEYLRNEQTTLASDIYAFGMCILEAFTGKYPWGDTNNIDAVVCYRVKCGFLPSRPVDMDDSQWSLIEKMCRFNPLERVRIDTVVNDLRILSEKKSLPSLPGMNSAITRGVLQLKNLDVKRSCKIPEFGLVCEILVLRLKSLELHEQISRDIQVQCTAIWSRLRRLLKLVDKSTSVLISRSRDIISTAKVVHADIDQLERALHQNPIPSRWNVWWQPDETYILQTILGAVNGDGLLLDDLNTKADLHEAISLLQYEIVVHGAKYSQESLDVLQGSLDTLLMLSDEEVPDIPRWFVPPHDVDLIICEERPESSQLYEATRGKWLGTDVTVIESRSSRENFVKDVDLWFQVSHPNVLKLYGACHLRHPYLALVENVQSMNLREYLDIEEHSDLKWQKLFGVGLGLKYLHERGCVTGDLRCDRIWVGTDGLAKVISKGSAVPNKSGMTSDTASFRPPECVESKEEFTTASDIFLFGLCIIEVITGNRSWRVDTRGVAASSIGWMALPPRPVEMNLPEWQLVESMCLFDPSRRVKIAYVVEHLKRFADQRAQAAEKTRAAGGASPAETDDLRVHIFPQLETTIEKFLEKLDAKSRLTGDSSESVEAIYQRIFDIYTLLFEMHKRPDDPVVTKFCEMLVQIDTFLGVVAVSKSSAVRRARSQRVSLQFNVLHRKIDVLLDMLTVSDLKSVVHRWKPEPTKNYAKPVEIGDAEDESSSKAHGAVRIHHFQGTGLNHKFQRIDSSASDPNSEEVTRFPWFIPFHEVKYNDVIGSGASGSVYHGLWLGTPVAIKIMGYEEDPDTVSRELFLHELQVWYPLHHPHVVKLFGAFTGGQRLFVCEFAPHGDLRSFLRHNGNISITWNKLLEAALGLRYLHNQNIVHNSLKCDDILIGVDGKAKIADFGLSSIPNSAEVMVDVERQGAINWKSPEYLRGDRPTPASGIYSFGMCILEAATRDIPWGNMMSAAVRFHVVRKCRLPSRPDVMNDRQWDLIEMMCAHEPSERLSMTAVVGVLTEFAHRESATNASKRSSGSGPWATAQQERG